MTQVTSFTTLIATPLEARPETGFLAVSRTISPLFPTYHLLKKAFLDGLLGVPRITGFNLRGSVRRASGFVVC